MGQFFRFEEDFAASLRCIPMQVRFKLDTAGVKLKLPHWHLLTPEERQRVMDAACETPEESQNYRTLLHQLIEQHGGDRPSDIPIEPHPDWLNETTIPDSVDQKARSLGVALGRSHWATLSPLQRFALIKLSRSNHENKNFLPALREFNVIDTL
jgi:hypothetical protein